MQEYRFTIAFMVEPHHEQVEFPEVEGERDEQLPADLQPFQEKPVGQRRAWLGPAVPYPAGRRVIEGIAFQIREAVQ